MVGSVRKYLIYQVLEFNECILVQKPFIDDVLSAVCFRLSKNSDPKTVIQMKLEPTGTA